MNGISFKNLTPFTFFSIDEYRYIKIVSIPAISPNLNSVNLNAFGFDYSEYVTVHEDLICQPLSVYPSDFHPYNDRLNLN